MDYRPLGRCGIRVSVIGLGAGLFGYFGRTPVSECIRIAHCAFDAGVNLVDTGDFYSEGESEVIIGKAIGDRRDKVVLATKLGSVLANDFNGRAGSRRSIFSAVDASLHRLGTDYIDLYQIHNPDPETDIWETVNAFNDLVHAGKIRAYGFSNHAAPALVEAHLRAQAASALPPHSEQGKYSIFARRIEEHVLPVCEKFGAGVLAYSPLDGGFLTGRYRRGLTPEPSRRQELLPSWFDLSLPHNKERLDAIEQLIDLAADAHIPLPHLALGFVLSHRAVTSALIGASSVAQLQALLALKHFTLADDVLDRIDAITTPGVDIGPIQPNLVSPALADSSLRRHSRAQRMSGVSPTEVKAFIENAKKKF